MDSGHINRSRVPSDILDRILFYNGLWVYQLFQGAIWHSGRNVVLQWTVGTSTVPGGHLTFCTEANVGFPRRAADQAILPVQVVGIELQINQLNGVPAHVVVFGTENFGVLELEVMTAVRSVTTNLWGCATAAPHTGLI